MNATGGPAFPIRQVDGEHETYKGMTLRDYFAAKAMAGIMAIPNHWYQHDAEYIAEEVYELADAMLKARSE